MKTHTTFVTILAITALAVPAFATPYAPPTVQVGAYAVPVDHHGPGVGSVKTPPFVHIDSTAVAVRKDKAYYHFRNDKSAWWVNSPHQGPGLGSSKSNGAGR